MKIRNREINIFSMSALDLFASGMGAFILLAVISLPFFGNTSSEIPKTCPVIPAPTECPAVPAPTSCPVCPVIPPEKPGFQKMEKLDIVVVLDISGSMESQIQGLKSEINGIASLLGRLSEQAALRIVVFGDNGFDRPVTDFPLTLVDDISRLEGYLKQIEVDIGMGSGSNTLDGEAVFPGIAEALRTPWRAEATQRVIVLLTDDAPHSGHGQPMLAAVKSFAASNPNYSVTVRYSGTDSYDSTYYQNLAIAGNGKYIAQENGSFTAILLLALLPK
jgi:hypothetical protein